MPLVDAHAFAVTMAVAAVVAIWSRRFRDWRSFFIPALALSIPQIAWLARGAALQTGRFVAWRLGWDRGTRAPLGFWLDNLGLFIPLLIVALIWGWRGRWLSKRHLLLYLPFLACFLVPNVLQLSPWIWDNIKFLIWWHVASAPLVALLLARVWRRRGVWRAAAGLAFVILTLSGALDVLRVASKTIEIRIYDSAAVAFGRRIRAVTPPGSIVLHAPTYNSEVFLAGRRSGWVTRGTPGRRGWTRRLGKTTSARSTPAGPTPRTSCPETAWGTCSSVPGSVTSTAGSTRSSSTGCASSRSRRTIACTQSSGAEGSDLSPRHHSRMSADHQGRGSLQRYPTALRKRLARRWLASDRAAMRTLDGTHH